MYAAGMTIKPENYAKFKNAFEFEVQKTILPQMRIPEIVVDATINFDAINPKLIRILKQFEPFGPQNRTPVFRTQNVFDSGYAKQMGLENEHLKLFLKQNNSDGIPAIGFNLGSKLELTTHKKQFDALYCIDENEWNGEVSVQLRLKDIQ